MPYMFEVYSFQDAGRAAAAQAKIDALEQAGWKPHTVSANFIEVAIFWERAGAPEESGQETEERGLAEEERDGGQSTQTVNDTSVVPGDQPTEAKEHPEARENPDQE